MAIDTSTKWDMKDLSHRYTASFFKWKYGDEPRYIFKSPNRKNNELNYFNIADPNNTVNATICAGLMVDYMEGQGIPYHKPETRADCFKALVKHLKVADGTVLYTADVIDHYFQFINEP